jgi:hypothetical protein
VPRDTLAAVKSVSYFKNVDEGVYAKKLKSLLSSNYVRKESQMGILSGSVYIENNYYDQSNNKNKNQTIMRTDALFLEIGLED